ncbi:hypothetical protein [Massiliimalia timonensis]|uniref:hypothetical protein n=1 Tax=Massiliimalia timonensis TaxID=1987501 RepID=UPI00189FB47B|nr:hypothetical protein [Massiliimalia timonensis]
MEIRNIPICWFDVNGGALYGKNELESAVKSCGADFCNIPHWTAQADCRSFTVVAGTCKDRRIQILLEENNINYHTRPESVFCQWCRTQNGDVLLLAGSDDTGLMYLLLDVARKVRTYGISTLCELKSYLESPDNQVRCMDRYLVGHLDNEWFLSERFWDYYLSRLAYNRFNRFCLILGFDTAYMAPPYPFFLTVKGFEQVKALKLTAEQCSDNLKALRQIGKMCHERGILFTLATWQQRPWTSEQDRLVGGLPEEEKALSEYCYAGLKALIQAVPEIDIVQFRVNHESGVGTQISAEDFWNHCTDAVAEVADETGRPLILDLRAKGLTDSMIKYAFSKGLQVEVPTKFWCEHAALPYHLSVMRSEEIAQLDNFNHSRRYSYADMLRKPKYFDVFYRLWNYGSTNLFLWGDPDYAQRFAQSCGLSGSIGYEVNAPLSLKYGHELSHREHWDTFADASLRSGEWEDERFWMWYIVFGRLGYNRNADPEIWNSEFLHRFGEAGNVLEKALVTASRIVPLVTTIHMPVHPSLRYWTELSTGWALFVENNLDKPQDYDMFREITYGSTEPSDQGLFYGIDEYASDSVSNKFSGKYSPIQTSQWLLDLAQETENGLAQAERKIVDSQNPEYLAMITDLTMLIRFARYHAFKMRAALALAFWKHTRKDRWLSDSAVLLDQAVEQWKLLSDLGSEKYHQDLNFSSAGSKSRRGTWADRMCELEADQKTMYDLLQNNHIDRDTKISMDYKPNESATVLADFPEYAQSGNDLKISAYIQGIQSLKNVPVLHYRHVDQTEGLFHTMLMEWDGNRYTAAIPAEYITPDWDLMVYVTVQGESGECSVFPGVYHPVYPYPYHVITVKETRKEKCDE